MNNNVRRLAVALYAIGVHGATCQDTEAGTLPAGTLVRNWASRDPDDGDGWWPVTFEASTDGGAHWYKQRSFLRYDDFAGLFDSEEKQREQDDATEAEYGVRPDRTIPRGRKAGKGIGSC